MRLSTIGQRNSVGGPDDQIKISIARSRFDLESAFRLVHDSYVCAGLDVPNPAGLRMTAFHPLSSTEVILAKHHGVAIATASLIRNGELGLPAESMYRDEIRQLHEKGMRVAEVGCFADRRESPVRFMQMFALLSTLIAQAAEFSGCNGLVAATHPRHAKFYIRHLGFERFGDLRDCPYVRGNPAVALLLDFEKHQRIDSEVSRHLFGQKYRDEELRPFEWDAETHQHFADLHAGWQDETNSRGVAAIFPFISVPTATTQSQPQ